MIAQEQFTMHEAAEVIHSALQAVGCNEPVDLVEHDTAIRIGTFAENLTVRREGALWKVQEYTPYLQRTMAYASLEECAHDIAMCEPGVLFKEVGRTEQEIDRAIARTEATFHHN